MLRVAPRNLGLRIVLAKSFARIHRQNLINYGVLPLVFAETMDYDRLERGDVISARDLRKILDAGHDIVLECKGSISVKHGLTPTQINVILAGGLINWRRNRDA